MIYEHQTATILELANEEKHTVDCNKSIQFVDEILVIDDGSTDQNGNSLLLT